MEDSRDVFNELYSLVLEYNRQAQNIIQDEKMAGIYRNILSNYEQKFKRKIFITTIVLTILSYGIVWGITNDEEYANIANAIKSIIFVLQNFSDKAAIVITIFVCSLITSIIYWIFKKKKKRKKEEKCYEKISKRKGIQEECIAKAGEWISEQAFIKATEYKKMRFWNEMSNMLRENPDLSIEGIVYAEEKNIDAYYESSKGQKEIKRMARKIERQVEREYRREEREEKERERRLTGTDDTIIDILFDNRY